MTTTVDPVAALPNATLPGLIALVEEIGQTQAELFARVVPRQLDIRDGGGWTGREVLSHVVGSWQRVPLWASFFLDGDPTVPVPIHAHDPFWIKEWETAPLAGFTLSLLAAISGNRAFLRALEPEALDLTHPTPFGMISLGRFLSLNYQLHIGGSHIPQLQALTTNAPRIPHHH